MNMKGTRERILPSQFQAINPAFAGRKYEKLKKLSKNLQTKI
jgi:hypothetical protein